MHREKTIQKLLQKFLLMMGVLFAFSASSQLVSPMANGMASTSYTDGSPNDDIFIYCGSGNNGSLEASVSSGSAPYTYHWYQYNNSNFSWATLAGQNSNSISNLASGGYRVEVTDNAGVNVLCDVAWIWNINVTLNAQANASACNDVNLSVVVPNVQFTYHNPPSPTALVNSNTDITVCFSGNHTYVSDLGYYLVGPASCGSPIITLAPNNGSVCNQGNNFNNLCFTTNSSPNFNVCNQNTPLSGTFDSSYGNPIDWSPLYGCNAAESGWSVMVYDCEQFDTGSLTHATINFQNLQSSCGTGSTINYNSGNINSAINDNSCNSNSASHFTVPLPTLYTTPLTLSATLSGAWSTSSLASITDVTSNITTADNAISGDVFTYTLQVNAGSCVCNFSDDVTYNNSSFVPLSISYPSGLCEGSGMITPVLTGATGGQFSASPAGLSISNNGNIQLNTSVPGAYVVTYTKTIGGCVLTSSVGITVQDVPENLALSPNTICEGQVFNGTAQTAFEYEYFLNGVSQGAPSTTSAFVSSTLNGSDSWCVRGYEGPAITLDGAITESYWGSPLSQANSALTSSFGNNNHLDALYVAQFRDTLNVAIAGQLENGTNNRFLLFLDTETGGFNQLSSWTNRSNAPYYSMENLSGGIQFDSGFEPDYIVALNTDISGISYLDLYHMATNTNNFLGSSVTNALAYQGAGTSIDITSGYELQLPLADLNNPSGSIAIFAMLVNNPGSAGIPTTLSNQFLSPADNGALSYGAGPVVFAAATPDPLHFIVGNTQCYLESCLTIQPNATLTLPVVPNQCENTSNPFVLNTTVGGVNGVWSPATIDVGLLGTGIYTFVPDVSAGCFDQGSVSVAVVAPASPSFAIDNDYCQGETPAILPSTDGTISGSWSPSAILTNAAATTAQTTYTFTPIAGQCANPYNFAVTVHPDETPVFSIVTSLCQNATAPTLPTTDSNGIQGTWNSPISTATLGSQVHTFTPSSTDPAHACAVPLNVTVNITNGTPATFAAVGPYCQSDSPTLPSTSNEGFTGTWSPSTINMTNFSAGGQNFTFQVDPNQCASNGTLNVVVQASVTPTFNAISNLCLNATPPALPSQSLQNVAGTWSPSTISTSTAGTSSYSFTPAAGACATAANISVTVQTPTTPNFTLPTSICKNATAPLLLANSANGVSGTWSPATVNSSIVGNQNFTFTPNAGVCATTYNYSLTVNNNQVPTFNSVGPFCINSTPTALPVQSLEPISGSWSPATINTAASGTSVYTFTPAAGVCAVNTAISVTVASQILPTFAAIPTLCSTGTAPSLATTSNNSITGSWSPSSINMGSIGTNAYVFTPAPNQCAANQTVNVTVNSPTVPTFTFDLDYCENEMPALLPAISINMINGSWLPTAISTTSAGSSTYSFTPSAGQCASNSSVTVAVNSPVDAVFAGLDLDYCLNETPALLAISDDNGVNGLWSPSVISTTTSGTAAYTFTPSAGECANATSVDVLVNVPLASNFGSIQNQYCLNDVAIALPVQNNDGITGTWSPGIVSTATAGNFNYVFTPTAGNCYATYSQSIGILNLPNVVFTSDFSAISCAHPNVIVTASGGLNYVWDDGTSGNVITTDLDFSNPGITVTDANGCINQANYAVPIDTATTSQLVYSTTVLNCLTTSIPIHAMGGQTYLWNPTGSNLSTINVNQQGSYAVDILFANGCSRTLSVDISIDTISPTGSISNFSGFDTLTCSQPSITLVANGGVSYEWVNGGNMANENYIVPGLIQVEVTGANHCLDTAEYMLYQNIIPPILNLAFSDSILDCFVDSIVIAATGNGVAYQWGNGLGSIDSIVISTPGNYSVTATGVNGCSSSAQLDIIEDRFQPDSLFTYSPQIVMDDDAIVELDGPSVSGVVYTWYLNDSLVVESDDLTLQLPTFHAGDFEVCLAANYTDLCKSSYCEIITIHESLQCYIPNTFTPDQDNVNEGFKPSFSNVALLEHYSMSIFDRWGECIFRSNDPNQSWDGRYLDGEYFVPDGAYYFEVQYKTLERIGVEEKKGVVKILR